ncbi:MAG: sulfite exporter TauE/SafE family protein [Acidilobaceae archaeon]|nr:sulfite exporter TauE/SafE family protein [Acidilobaceae archaeon]
MEAIVYVLLGATIAMIASMSGVGGGVFMVPLFYHMGYPINQAVGTSLFVIVFNSISATISYWRRGLLRPGSWIVMSLLMIPSSALGAHAVAFFPRELLVAIVALLVTLFSLNLLLTSEKQGEGPKSPLLVPLAGLVAGFIAGLAGVGGGVVLMPVLVSVLNVPVHEAVAASMMSIVLSSIFGSAVHAYHGNIVYSLAFPFAVGAIVGGQLGSYVASRTSPSSLRRVVGVILIAIAISMFLR